MADNQEAGLIHVKLVSKGTKEPRHCDQVGGEQEADRPWGTLPGLDLTYH